MKIDSVLMEKVKGEYRKYCHNWTVFDEKGYKETISSVGGVVELDNGLLYTLEKPRVKTDFGHGRNGVSDEESCRFAVEGSDGVKEKAGFINANLRMFDRDHKHLFNEKLFCFRIRNCCNYNEVGIVRVACVENAFYNQVGEVSDSDRRRIAEEVGRMRGDFRKRLEAYWKRYGSKHLRSWTYLVD